MSSDQPVERLDATLARWVERLLGADDRPWDHGPAAPGAAWGIVSGGRLVRAGGAGVHVWPDGEPPTAGTVFRIASMTKSFTAAAVLQLRDRGLIDLDQPVLRHVPEAIGLAGLGRAGRGPSIDGLLRMAGGLAEDDPLGDRLQGLSAAGFDAMLAQTAVPATAGAFEYSNLGYAVLGRLIERVGGSPFATAIGAGLLRPLGLSSTTWTAPPGMAGGYVWRDAWQLEPVDPPGAFGAMGGLFSTVADLAVWVAHLSSGDPGGGLAVASRADLAMPRTRRPPLRLHDAVGPIPAWYGYGLNVAESPTAGPLVWHSGGYPGFGSCMAWAPEHDLGAILLMNGRYAPASRALLAALHHAVEHRGVGGRRPTAPAGPGGRSDDGECAAHPGFAELQQAVSERLEALPGDLPMALNIELDEPWEQRRVAWAHAREVLGLTPAVTATRLDTPLRGTWTLAGASGTARVTMMLGPVEPLQIQSLDLDVAVRPGEAMVVAGRALVAVWDALAAGQAADRLGTVWSALDQVAVARRVGEPVAEAGDGRRWTRWRVPTTDGDVQVTLVLDDAGRPVTLQAVPA